MTDGIIISVFIVLAVFAIKISLDNLKLLRIINVLRKANISPICEITSNLLTHDLDQAWAWARDMRFNIYQAMPNEAPKDKKEKMLYTVLLIALAEIVRRDKLIKQAEGSKP